MPKTINEKIITVAYIDTIQNINSEKPKMAGAPVDSNNPKGPRYPYGVDIDDLNQTATRIIQYIDENENSIADSVVETINMYRSATIDYTDFSNPIIQYGGWGTSDCFIIQESPQVKGYITNKTKMESQIPSTINDEIIIVKYIDTNQVVTPDCPKTFGDPIDPKNPDGPKYPAGVSTNDLNQLATRNIKYENTIGQTLASSQTQTTKMARIAMIDYTNLLKPVITYGAWVTKEKFLVDFSPNIIGYVTNQIEIPAQAPITIGAETITIKYIVTNQTVDPDKPKIAGSPVDPDNPDGTKYPVGVDTNDLNQTTTRTIQYIDQDGTSIASPIVQNVAMRRVATINYVDVINPTITYGNWISDGVFNLQNNPIIFGYITAEVEVPEKYPTKSAHEYITIQYVPVHQTVKSNEPKQAGKLIDVPFYSNSKRLKYPQGVDTVDLNQNAVRNIQYIDILTGKHLSDLVTQTISMHRIAIIDYSNFDNPTIYYGDWISDNSFKNQTSPIIEGYTTNKMNVLNNPPLKLVSTQSMLIISSTKILF